MLDDDGEDAVTMATKEKVDDVIRTGNLLRILRSVRARTYWGWVVTVASSIMFVVSYGFLYSFGIIMVDLMSEFDSSATDTGYIGAMAYGLSSLSCLVTVPLAVRVGYQFISMLGLISCVISCIVTSFAPDLSLMYFSHGFLYGIGASLMMTGGINITQSYFTGKHNSLAIAISSAGSNIGVLAMNPFVYTLSARFGWRTMFRIISAVLVIVCVPAILTFAPAPLQNAEDVEAEKLEEKSVVLCKNSKMFVEVKDGNKSDKQTFERTCCEEETTSVCRSTGSRKKAEDDRTVSKSDWKSIGGHDTTLHRYSFRNRIRDEEQSNLLVADGTNSDIIPYHESNSIWAVSSKHKCSDESYKVPHVNVIVPQFESSLDDGANESDSRPTDTKSSTSNDAPEVQRNTYCSRLIRLLRMPDMWFLEMGMMTTSVALSFFMFSTANVIVTAGFSKKTASLVMAVVGFSEALGKIVIGLVADRLRIPIPKIFILMAAMCGGLAYGDNVVGRTYRTISLHSCYRARVLCLGVCRLSSSFSWQSALQS
ncbi:uncharacterized protein LOC100893677 [Strongylocentrotus purpuratus]|uniref:Monocarboxylate transporter n=1 Tax=Strongylocentrotus purpuratus TaxID=7668 RepID=A0A7M7PP09_STRPU|nr:uncharacterized protein LOC100893677 [Strongylocentrotus purpuratus]